MRLRAEILAIVLAAIVTAAGALHAQSPQPSGAGPSDADITQALETVKADPNLATEKTINVLQWKDRNRRAVQQPSWLKWIVGFFAWVSQSARALVWLTVAALVGVVVVRLLRMAQSHTGLRIDDAWVAPTHVRDLDIRPESLPHDLGAAARALWDRGDHRAALALLYRGLLSRLAHVHKVPIRDSSTEGECLALAQDRLAAPRHEYASRLVHVWQRFVYGGEDIQTPTVHLLTDEFARTFDRGAPR